MQRSATAFTAAFYLRCLFAAQSRYLGEWLLDHIRRNWGDGVINIVSYAYDGVQTVGRFVEDFRLVIKNS